MSLGGAPPDGEADCPRNAAPSVTQRHLKQTPPAPSETAASPREAAAAPAAPSVPQRRLVMAAAPSKQPEHEQAAQTTQDSISSGTDSDTSPSTRGHMLDSSPLRKLAKFGGTGRFPRYSSSSSCSSAAVASSRSQSPTSPASDRYAQHDRMHLIMEGGGGGHDSRGAPKEQQQRDRFAYSRPAVPPARGGGGGGGGGGESLARRGETPPPRISRSASLSSTGSQKRVALGSQRLLYTSPQVLAPRCLLLPLFLSLALSPLFLSLFSLFSLPTQFPQSDTPKPHRHKCRCQHGGSAGQCLTPPLHV